MKRHEIDNRQQIVILCEGSTEVKAVNLFLRHQWEEEGLSHVALRTDDLRGHVDNVIIKTALYLQDDKVISVFTLVDLCRFKLNELSAIPEKPNRIEAAKRWFIDKIDVTFRARFFPHFAVYEIETWILAEGHALSARLRDNSIKPNPNAEDLNDQDTPKSRLNRLFKKYGKHGYREIFDGTALFGKMKFDVVYCSCPNFRAFFDDLRRVASKAT